MDTAQYVNLVSWDELGQVGNQRNYRNLTLKKRLEKEERKKEEEYRIQSRLEREATNKLEISLKIKDFLMNIQLNLAKIIIFK